jgi:hypothetical protein
VVYSIALRFCSIQVWREKNASLQKNIVNGGVLFYDCFEALMIDIETVMS